MRETDHPARARELAQWICLPGPTAEVTIRIKAALDAAWRNGVEAAARSMPIASPAVSEYSTTEGRAWCQGVNDKIAAIRAILPPDRDAPDAVGALARDGLYVASRASVPERSAMWRKLRGDGIKINSTWIDEAGEGETSDFAELWMRIYQEIEKSSTLILYAESGDFPLKGALIEAGIAIGLGIPVNVVLPGVVLEDRTDRPIGSWIRHPKVMLFDTLDDALNDAALTLARRPGDGG